MAGTKISSMPAVGSSGATAWADADLIPVVDTSATTNRKLTRAQLRQQLFDSPADGDVPRYSSTSGDFVLASPANQRYRTVATARYTGTIGGTPSIITMSNTGDMGVGYPVRYVVSGTTYYGIITSLSTNASITVAGPALAAAATVSALAVGTPDMVTVVQLFVANAYGDNVVSTLLATDMKTYFKWSLSAAYCVRFSVTHDTAAGTTQPTVNVNIGGSAVSTSNSNNGILPTTSGAWVDNTLASINSSNYDIVFGDTLEVACTVAGSPTSGALNLTVLCVFVQG